jgi:hypothetical protein
MADSCARYQWGGRVTRPARSVAAVSAVMADRYATAAAAAAREATRAANIAVQRRRAQDLGSRLILSEEAARSGSKHEQLIEAGVVYGQMAGIASTAKYAAAAVNATRYAADAAREAGAHRAAQRAERAARVAAGWADMARRRAETSHYAPYTALMTARYARLAAAAAHNAARASGPLGRCTTRAVGLAAALLPPASRERYIEEWKSDLYHTPTRLRRARFVPSMLAGAARLAVVLRQPASRSRP